MDYNSIQAVVTQIAAQPTSYFSQQLLTAVQSSNNGVSNALFGGTSQAALPNLAGISSLKGKADASMGVLSTFSLIYVSYVISTNSTYGFNKTIQNVSFGDVSNWINNNSSSVGMAMFLDYLAASDKLAPAFTDANATQQSAQVIVDNLGSKDAFEMLIAQLQHGNTSASVFPAKVFLVLLNALDNGGTKFTSLQSAWQQSSYWDLVSDWASINWFDTVSVGFNQNASQYNVVNQAVSTACSNASNVSSKTEMECPMCSGGPAATCPPCYEATVGTTTTYGQPLLDWLNSSSGPLSLGYRSGSGPDNVVTTGNGDGGGGCLLVGTRVLAADGSWILIEDVKPGAKLLNGKQEVVVVSSETVVNHEVDAVYGINDDEPMMSKEHAVMTQRGWCSLNPELSMSLNPHIKVGLLSLGDVVWRMQTDAKGNRKIVLEEVKDIKHQLFEKGAKKTGISFNLGSGGHTIWANGYCTLDNFPELTAGKIAHNLKHNMSGKEGAQLLDGLKKAAPLFEKVLGSASLESIVEVFKNGNDLPDTGFISPHKDLSNLTIPHLIPSFKSSDHRSDISSLSIINGKMLINGQPADTHTDKDHLYWTRQNSNGEMEHGALRFSPNRLSAHGMMTLGNDTTAVSVYTKVDYNTTYGDNNAPWYEFEMGFQQNDDGTKTQYGQLLDENGQVMDTNNYTTAFGLVKNQDNQTLMTVDIEFKPTWVAWTKFRWIAATFTFTNDYQSFTGAVYEYDNTKPQNRGQGYPLRGVYAPTSALNAQNKALTSMYMAQPVQTEA
ncbi:MAG TPA: hypothetical protein PLR06_06075, partial [Cyclobacteriaceae bacterium]|nr:hypothetical protein [Cyclobacteriaceae bacterium]